MLTARAEVTNPNDAQLKLTLSMTVGEWKKVMDQLPETWPHWQLASVIRQAVYVTVDRVELIHEDIKA